VVSIVTLGDVVDYLVGKPEYEAHLVNINAYRQQYGI
jgi:hypothetical protein